MSAREPSLDELLRAARAVRARAHAPYSQYRVGAALRDERGAIHVGANVENASYGLTVCAERNAIGALVASGRRRVTDIVVVTGGRTPGTPCGACRQVLAEFAAPGARVTCVAGPRLVTWTLDELLPGAFGVEVLAQGRGK